MNKRRVIVLFISIVIIPITQSCFVFGVREFSEEDMKWFLPYKNTETIIFRSERNEFDTIIFLKADTNVSSTRCFQSGFYNTRTMKVTYQLTAGSYHKFAERKEWQENERLMYIEKNSSRNRTYTEICFLGIIYSGKELEDNVRRVDFNTYFFDGRKATYSRINIREGITHFTFDTDHGILEYTDERNVNWKRKGSNYQTL